MYEKAQAYIQALNDLRQLKKKQVLESLCKKDKDGNITTTDASGVTVYNFDNAKIRDFICKLIEENDLPDEYKNFFELDENGKFKHDLQYSMNAETIENLIVKNIDRDITKFRVYGETLVQAPNTLFEKNVNFTRTQEELKQTGAYAFPKGTNGLKFYTLDENGKVLSMKVKVPLSDKFKALLEIDAVVNDEDVKSGKKTKLQKLNELLQNEKWFSEHKEMFTMIAVRIPTQGHNSIEMMEIYEFMPPEGPNSIILPSEIVVKSGGDYDIDKMPIMMPHISKVLSEENGVIKTEVRLDNDIDKNVIENNDKILRKHRDEIIENFVDNNAGENVISQKKQELAKSIDEYVKYQEQIDELKSQKVDAKTRKDWAHNAKVQSEIDAIIEKIAHNIEWRKESKVLTEDEVNQYKNLISDLKAAKTEVKTLAKEYIEAQAKLYSSSRAYWYKNEIKHKLKELGETKDKKELNALYNQQTITFSDGTTISVTDYFGLPTTINNMEADYKQALTDLYNIKNLIASYIISNPNNNNVVKEDSDALNIIEQDLAFNKKLRKELETNQKENTLHNTMADIMSDKSTFKSLITPNDTDSFKGQDDRVVDSVRKTLGKETTFGYFSTIDPIRNMEDRMRFVAGKDGLGIAAVDNVDGAMFNIIGLTCKANYYDKYGKAYPITLALKHNSRLVNDEECIDLSRKYVDSQVIEEVSDTLRDISNTNNQMINGYVDVAKDAWVKDIGADKTRTPALLFLIKAGVSIDDAVYLMLNPMVRRFCELYDVKKGVTSKLSITDDENLKAQLYQQVLYEFGYELC